MAITHYPIDPPVPLQPGWYVVGIKDDKGFIEAASSKEDAIIFIHEAMLATSISIQSPDSLPSVSCAER